MLDIDKIAFEVIEEKIKIPISEVNTKDQTMFVSSAIMATVKALSILQKEYEEKLRWIPVEEKKPESNKIAIIFKTKEEKIYYGFYGLSCNFYVMLAGIFDKNIQVDEVTHWRYFL